MYKPRHDQIHIHAYLFPSDVSLPFTLPPSTTDVGSLLKGQQKPGPTGGHRRDQQGRRNGHPIQTETTTTITVTWRGELPAVSAPAHLTITPTTTWFFLILLGRMFPLQLYSTAFPGTVHDLQLRVDDLLDQLIGFRCKHRSLRVLSEHLDARFMH